MLVVGSAPFGDSAFSCFFCWLQKHARRGKRSFLVVAYACISDNTAIDQGCEVSGGFVRFFGVLWRF